MESSKSEVDLFCKAYINKISDIFTPKINEKILELCNDIVKCLKADGVIYICGNGGSAGNAIHIANDFHYGLGQVLRKKTAYTMKVEALCSNQAVITCLANDTGYENIYSDQIRSKCKHNDMLISLSGSGNSQNILNAIDEANKIGMQNYGILAFDGGKALRTSAKSIHFEVRDMQVAEDVQLITGHLCMQWLVRELNLKRVK